MQNLTLPTFRSSIRQKYLEMFNYNDYFIYFNFMHVLYRGIVLYLLVL